MLALGIVVLFAAAVWAAYLAGTARPLHALLGFALPLVGGVATFAAGAVSVRYAAGCFAVLVVCVVVGLWCGYSAHRKKLNVAGYATLGFFLPMIGIVVVASEPPSGTETAAR